MTEHFTQAGMKELAGDIGISFYPRCFSDKDLTDLCNAAVNHKLKEWGYREPVATINDLRNSLMFSLEVGGYSRKDKLYAAPVAPEQPAYDPIGAWNKGFEEGKRLAEQAKAAPVQGVPDGRIVECAKRLVEHADFKLGGCLSSDSKSKEIPSNAISHVKARHLAALRDALLTAPQQEQKGGE